MPPIASIILIALVFFVGIPGIGAFSVRRQWRRFRRRVAQASLWPLFTYRVVRKIHDHGVSGETYRFFGALEAIQSDQALWLRGGDVTVAADMSSSEIYVLPRDTGELPDEPPVRTTWARLGSLTEGAKVFAAGRVRTEGTHAVLWGDASDPLLVVLYDGSERDLLRRCIWSGRQLNEYWNQLTPGALAGGTLALITIAYVLLRSPAGRLPAIASLTLSSIPLLPLLPPGVAFFFIYRWSWRRGRILRAHRDILRVPLRHLEEAGGPGVLPDGEPYELRYLTQDEAKALEEIGGQAIRPPVRLNDSRYAAFGHPGGAGLETPPDPMTEIAIIPGDPSELSRRCQRQARAYELASAALLGTTLLINLATVFAVLQYVVR